MTISQSYLVQAPVSRLLRQLLLLANLPGHYNQVNRNLRVPLCPIIAPLDLRILMALMVPGRHLDLPLCRTLGPLRHRQHLRTRRRHHLSRPTSHRRQMLHPIVPGLTSPLLLRPRPRPQPAIHARLRFLVEHPFKARTTHRR